MQPLYATPSAAAHQDQAHAAIAGTLPPSIVMTLTELFGSDLQQWRFIVDLFCDTVTQDLANLETAISAGVDGAIVDAAHRIVGSARMLGHEPIGNAARVVERIGQSIGAYKICAAAMQAAFCDLRALVDEFRLRAGRCAWPDAA